jgi:hypothetical protein
LKPYWRDISEGRPEFGKDGFKRYVARKQDCAACALKPHCTPNHARGRSPGHATNGRVRLRATSPGQLLKGLQANVSVDWAHRESARARLRVLVKRILRKFGYPPDLEDDAIRGVLAQAEALLSGMASA